METLTYGTLPDFQTFAKAFDFHVPLYMDMRLSENDVGMFESCGLQHLGAYNLEHAHDLLESLCAINDGHVSHGEPWSDEQMEWAGEFASSIMTTLGFEWV